MAEFAAGLEDGWGLQSIIGGGGGSGSGSGSFISTAAGSSAPAIVSAVPDSNSNSFYGVMDLPIDDGDFFLSFPDLYFESNTRSQTQTLTHGELQGRWCSDRPLTMVFRHDASGSDLLASSSADTALVGGEVHDEEKQIRNSVVKAAVTEYVPKYKRRKNQQKRVVLHVTAEDLSSDMWAWRKYGQKPIKGSPYPRSYYRCSSTKGCLARRQVEQSCTDPSVFIVTYSGEHNHSQPTRKNALAGTIRHKFPNSKYASPQQVPPSLAQTPPASSSPSSSSTTSTAAVVMSPVGSPSLNGNSRNVKLEMTVEEIDEVMMMDGMNGRKDGENFIFSGIKLDDDFFSGLEDIDDLISELSNGYCSTKQQFPTP